MYIDIGELARTTKAKDKDPRTRVREGFEQGSHVRKELKTKSIVREDGTSSGRRPGAI